MAFRRIAGAGLGATSLALGGALVTFAWQAHLYATTSLLCASIVWGVFRAAWRQRSEALALPARSEPPSANVAARDLRLAKSLIDHTPAPLLSVDQSGVIHAFNRAARRLFQTDDRLTTPQPDLTAALARGEAGRRLTVTLATPDGPRGFALSITDLIDSRGPSRLAALVDIQPEIRAAEAAAMRDLMQVLSHEIMNTLTPVASLAATARDLLDDEVAKPLVEAREAVAILARRAEGLTRFVDAYRSLARLPPPHLAPVALGGLLDEAAQLFHGRWRGLGVSLNITKPEPDIIVDLDRDLMVHALSNILSNGAEAVLANPENPAVVTLAAAFIEGRVQIRISDTGPGVAPVDAEAIFRPFFTTKAAGSGIGLTFAAQVTASHGGTLALADSSDPSGATFVLTL